MTTFIITYSILTILFTRRMYLNIKDPITPAILCLFIFFCIISMPFMVLRNVVKLFI